MNTGLMRLGVVTTVLIIISAVNVIVSSGQREYQRNPVYRPSSSNYDQNQQPFIRFSDYFQPSYNRRVFRQKSTTDTSLNEEDDRDALSLANRGNFKQSSHNEPPALPFPSIFQDDQDFSLTQEVVNANNRFGAKLFNVIKESEGNFVFSSFSLASILCMLQAGTSGQTFEEIQNAMTFSDNQENVHKGFQSLQSSLKTSNSKDSVNSTLVTSNRLFIKEGIDLNTEFQGILKESFNSPAQQIDFGSKNAASKINKLVAEDTRQQIPELIDAGILNNRTRLVALNALYFKSAWNIPFHGRATRPGEFYKHGVEKTDVQMMNIEEYFKITNYLDSKVIVLPYIGEETEMILLVPNEKDGLANLEKVFSEVPSAYDDLIANLSKKLKNIVLHLPRFSIQSTHDLKDGLMKLGIKQAFEENNADFSKMTNDKKDLFLSKILQKAFLKVDEAGSEAGAASYGAVFTPLSIGPAIEETIIVNRPFMGFIRNTKNNLILFTFRKVE